MAGLHNLRPARGSRQPGKRVGRGNAARRGNFSGRGIKGQRARESIPPLFEGGQLPLVKRLPAMRGFKNRTRIAYQPVNIGALNQFRKGAEINPQALLDARIIRNFKLPIKILGSGKIEKDYKVSAHAFSAAARKAIENSGGTCTELPHKRKAQEDQEDAEPKKQPKAEVKPPADEQPPAEEPAKPEPKAEDADQQKDAKAEPEAKAEKPAKAEDADEAVKPDAKAEQPAKAEDADQPKDAKAETKPEPPDEEDKPEDAEPQKEQDA